MKKTYDPRALDVTAFAKAGAVLDSAEAIGQALRDFPRLQADAVGESGDTPVHWRAAGHWQDDASGGGAAWLRLEAEASVPLVCQRCLAPVDTPLAVARDFRFVADEATAELEDEESEEDVLALTRDFDLLALVEDELLMELPLVPAHDVCPQPVTMQAEDPGFEAAQAAKPNPFAALAQLKKPKS